MSESWKLVSAVPNTWREADAAVDTARRARTQRIERQPGIECIGAEAFVEAHEQLRRRIEIGFGTRRRAICSSAARGMARIAASAEMYSTTRAMLPTSRLPRKRRPQPYVTHQLRGIGEERRKPTPVHHLPHVLDLEDRGIRGQLFELEDAEQRADGIAAGTIEPIA